MFSYADPTGTGFLAQAGALDAYRRTIDVWYQSIAAVPGSSFALRDAFEELASGTTATVTTVEWKAFPVTAVATPEQIDQGRFNFQDEYVEWKVDRRQDGTLSAITITTEFSEYFEALAQIDAAALKKEIQNVYPGSMPTDEDLFGPDFDPESATPKARATRFREHLTKNPWNNGERGILCLTQQFNTMGALFNLLGHCGVSKPDMDAEDVCANVGGFCGPGRNSDPRVCTAAQNLARGSQSLALQDPAGIRILRLEGLWTVDGKTLDINDESTNQGSWKLLRNGRRAVFRFDRNVLLAGSPVRTGTEVSSLLTVGADVIHAATSATPSWAQREIRQSRRVT
jgi:hypothetical protein